MATQVVTQLIVDASGARQGVAEFEAAMAKAKAAAVDSGTVTGDSFEKAQRKWVQSLGATDPVIKAQIAMQDAMAKQTLLGNKAVELGITTQAAAASQLDKVRQKYQEHVTAAQRAQSASTAFGGAMSDVSKQLVALSAGAGPVGTFLSAIPGWGLPAAIALGAIVEALRFMSAEAHRMGELARMLQDSAHIMGVTTDQLQALNIAAASVGVSAEKNTLSFERFTVQLRELRDGAGALFVQLHQVSPELTKQLASTKDVTSAIDLLAKSYAEATDQIKKNAIARAAFGRGGFAEGNVLVAINNAGGLDAYRAGLNQADFLTQEQIKHWGALSIEIEHATNAAKNNFASIFTGPVLEGIHKYSEGLLDISRMAKEFVASPDLLALLKLTSPLYLIGKVTGVVGPEAEASTKPKINIVAPKPLPGTNPIFDANEMKLWTSAMGDALTIEEKFRLKTLELNKAYREKALGEIGSTEALDRLKRAQDSINLDKVIAQESLHNSLLGVAASTYAVVKEKMDQVQKAQAQGAGLTTAERENIRRLATEQANGTAAIIQQTDAMKVQSATLGLGAGAATQLHAALTLQLEDIRKGKTASDEDNAARQKTIGVLGAQADALAKLTVAKQIEFEKKTAFLSDIDVQIANQLKGIYGNDITAALASDEAAALRFQAVQKSVIQEFKTGLSAGATTFVQSMQAGKSVMDSMVLSARSLSQSLTSSAITQLFSGNYIGAAVAGVGAIVSGLFGARQTSQEIIAAANARQDVSLRSEAFVSQRFTASGQDQTIQGAIANFERQANAARIQELRAGNGAIDQLEKELAAEREKIINDFAKKAIDAENARLAVIDNLNRALNTVQGKDFLNSIGDLIKQVSDFETNGADPAKLAQFFDLSAQKIVDGASLTGDAFNNLTDIFPQLVGHIHEATKALTDQAAAEAKINATAKSIVDYVNGLTAGSGATVSPQARLQNAQAAYTSQLVLAQSGNADAQSTITKYAEDFRTAAQAYYASSAQYQTILSQISSQLLALPAVQQATDPVVLALRDVLLAAQQTRDNIAGVNTTISTVLKQAVDSGNAAATAQALSSYFSTLDTNVNGLIDFNEMKTALGGMASDAALRDMFTRLDTDNSGSLSKLELIKGSTATTSTNTGNTAGSTYSIDQRTAAANATLEFIHTGTDRLQDVVNLLGGSASGVLTQYLPPILSATNDTAYQTKFFYVGHTDALTKEFARGGLVDGGVAGQDSVRAMLMPGEWINTAATVGRLGSSFFQALDQGMTPALAVGAANDNSPVVSALSRMTSDLVSRLDRLEQRLVQAEVAGAEHVGAKLDQVAEHAETTAKASRRRA